MNAQCARCFSSMFRLVNPNNARLGCAFCTGKDVRHVAVHAQGVSGQQLLPNEHRTIQLTERRQDLLCP